MSTYDLSSLRTFLSPREPRLKNNTEVKNLLNNWGINDEIANPISKNELCYWTTLELTTLFSKLATTPTAIKAGLRSFDNGVASTANPGAGLSESELLKPDVKLMLQSIEKRAALCVNEQGKFQLRDSEYVAMSHVWIEGVGADLENRGLPRRLIKSIFERIRGLGVEWIWLDSLAIPGGVEKLGLQEEILKTSLINCLADVYRKAKAVVILDALVLRLDSVNPVETAAVLCCGAWMTRMWTYQEIKLAKHAIVVTKQGLVTWKEMAQTLTANAEAESGEIQGYHVDKHSSLAKTLGRLERNDALGVSLPDLAYGCGNRKAGVPLDHARALFPTLGLEWKTKYTMEEAMKKLYLSQKGHATRVVLYHGPLRNYWPGWAPASFSNLIDAIILEESAWMRRGLKRRWFTSKVGRIVPSKPDALILALENPDGSETLTGCKVSPHENPKSVAEFKKSVGEGTAYLLSDDALYPKRPFAWVALLVEKFQDAEDLEAWVCMTVAVFDTEPTFTSKTDTWLLLHENPVSDHHGSGKGFSELNYMMEKREQVEGPLEGGETTLHVAARTGNEALFSKLLLAGGMDIDSRDDRGLTPLHSAASTGQTKLVELLAKAGAEVNAMDRIGRTPMIWATDNGHLDAVVALFEAGADVNLSDPRDFSAMMTATRAGRADAVRLLAALGADPLKPDAGGWIPLMICVAGSRDDDVLEALLEAGADPNLANSSGLTPLEGAARAGHDTKISKLIAYGADPNVIPLTGFTPLYYAIEEQSEKTVQALLSNGADASYKCKGDWTPMLAAMKTGNFEIAKQLRASGAGLDDICQPEGWSAAHIAAKGGHRVIVRWLLQEGANIKRKDADGKTADYYAEKEGHHIVATILRSAKK